LSFSSTFVEARWLVVKRANGNFEAWHASQRCRKKHRAARMRTNCTTVPPSEIIMSKTPHTIPENQAPPPPTEEDEAGAEAIISPSLERGMTQQPDSNTDPTIKNH